MGESAAAQQKARKLLKDLGGKLRKEGVCCCPSCASGRVRETPLPQASGDRMLLVT